ncbi:MAG: hypothetical protein U9P80_10170 [Thermodesulfobacteriota bacterium]|nr:hypothetical protein [Thermodesulfobacteriota bacterium]
MKTYLYYIMSFLVILCLSCPVSLSADERAVPDKPDTIRIKITFNNETIHGLYNVIDVRTDVEKTHDQNEGRLKGEALVFFTGHAQRPADAYKFANRLAMLSRSGVVIVPVCDTPYGKNKAWRGDRGKDVILMEMVRYILAAKDIAVRDYTPLTAMDVIIRGKIKVSGNPFCQSIETGLSAVGWSHGCILSRRFAHAYPDTVTGMAQMCPAGYEHWGSPRMLTNFAWESLGISTLGFRGHFMDVVVAGWGITKGITGDFCRSIPLAIVHLQPSKMCRTCRDISECTRYCDDTILPINKIDNIIVIFGQDDSCMDAGEQAAINDIKEPTPTEIKAFWERFYPSALVSNAGLTFRILPGSHLAPITHNELYARTVLEGLEGTKTSEDQGISGK